MTVQYVKRNKYEQMRKDAIERILTAAEELFAVNGYTATTIQKIAVHAEMVPSAIYHYFVSKESVLEAVLERETEVLNQLLIDGLRKHLTTRGINDFLNYMRDCVYENRERISLMCQLTQLRCVPESAQKKLNVQPLFNETIEEYIFAPEARERLKKIMPDFVAGAVLYVIAGNRDIFEQQIEDLKQKAAKLSLPY